MERETVKRRSHGWFEARGERSERQLSDVHTAGLRLGVNGARDS